MNASRFLFTAVTLAAPGALHAQAAPKEVDAYVTATLRRFDQPGAAIAVVKDGKVVFQQGWGVRRLGEAARVDDQTLFQIASNTKAVTAAALAILVDDGKLRWNDPVTDYLPWFRLGGDPYVTREFTVRDLLVHRSGLSLGAGDLLWFHSDYGREEIARRLRYIAPTASFRSRYAYDNVLFIVAGLVVEAASGMSWDDFVRTRIFGPLGLRHTQTSVRLFRPGDDVAAAHGRIDGRMQVVPWDTVDNIGPAGAINSSAAEWARWLLVQLDSGRVDASRRLWSAARTREMWSPEINIPIGDPDSGFEALRPDFQGYALGWGIRDYRGRKIVTHTGGLSGMLSRVFLVPSERLGIVVLTNGETSAFNALGWWLLDYYLGAPRTDWAAAFARAAQRTTSRDRAFEDSAETARRQDVGPSLPLSGYAGTYTDAWYGDVTLALEGGHLVLHWSHSPSLAADLEHWQYDTFRARMRARTAADAFVTFALKPDGRVDRMTLVPVLPSTDFSFNYQDLLFRPAQ
jgi:CubicO group peptidase (beta-lactamase class C family)